MNILRTWKLWTGPWDWDDHGNKRIGSWSQAFSGQRYWSLDPRADEIHLMDICVGLANAARYRGQTSFFYPVITHCTLVSRSVEKLALDRGWSIGAAKNAALEGLFHDASEAYLGDVARPLKRMPAMKAFCKIEALWEEEVCKRFDISSNSQSRALVKEVDNRIVLDEIHALMEDPDMWRRSGRYLDLEPLGIEIPDWHYSEAIEKFVERYTECVV